MEITAQNAAQEPTLDQVLGTFENFLQTIIQGVIDASPEDETKLLAEATAETLQLQLQKVHGFVRENHARLSPIQQEEMRKFLQTQDGHNMARRGAETARAIFKKKQASGKNSCNGSSSGSRSSKSSSRNSFRSFLICSAGRFRPGSTSSCRSLTNRSTCL